MMKAKRSLCLFLSLLLTVGALFGCVPTAPGDTTAGATTAVTTTVKTTAVTTTAVTTTFTPPPAAEGILEITFLDVGQADCILLRSEESTVLVDTGYKKNAVTDKIISHLTGLGITTLDYLVLTHPHADHIGGAPDIINAFTVRNCLMPDAVATTKIFEDTLTALEEREVNVIEAVAGNRITLSDMVLEILAPRAKEYSETNDYSVVLRVLFGSTALMLTGDAELLSEGEMLQSFGSEALKADLLKVGHHGSTTSSGGAFLSAVDPDFAVISCGEDNSYGHPHDEIVERLSEAGITTYRTDLHGTVIFTSDGEEITLLSKEK